MTFLVLFLLGLPCALGVFQQEGPKLVGTGATGDSQQGRAVSISRDGLILAVGGLRDNSGLGAVWLYSRSGTTWTQQQRILGVGTGEVRFGASVALNANGATLVVGAPSAGLSGLVRIYVRNGGGTWTLQQQLSQSTVGYFGASVAVSGDGNTLAVGDWLTSSNTGATYIYQRSGVTWNQGPKLVGTGAIDASRQGFSLSMSDDGNTVAVGGISDTFNQAGVWVFGRANSSDPWSQLGPNLQVDITDNANFGSAVALSGNGQTIAAGGPAHNNRTGGVWVFQRNASDLWTQEGPLLTVTGGVNSQGKAVSLSYNGNLLAIGCPSFPSSATAVFERSLAQWTQSSLLVGSNSGLTVDQGTAVALSGAGERLVIGGPADSEFGAAWVFFNDGSPATTATTITTTTATTDTTSTTTGSSTSTSTSSSSSSTTTSLASTILASATASATTSPSCAAYLQMSMISVASVAMCSILMM